jgi:hypothetical protein
MTEWVNSFSFTARNAGLTSGVRSIGASGAKTAGYGALKDFAGRAHGTDEPIGRFQQIGAFPAEDIVILETERFRLGKFAGQVRFHLLVGCKRAA